MKFLEVKELRRDFLYGSILGTVLSGVSVFFGFDIVFTNLFYNLGFLSLIFAVFSLFSTLLLLILFLIPENNKIKFLKRHPAYKYFHYPFFISIYLSLILFTMCVVSLFVFPYVFFVFLKIFFVVIFFWWIFSLYRCVWFVKNIIELLEEK